MTCIADLDSLDALSAEQLRTLAAELIEKVDKRDRELHLRQTHIDQVTHQIALLKRLRYGARSEQLHSGQASLLEESVDADLAAIETELEALQDIPPERKSRQQPKRAALPAHLPRTEIHHEPENLTCACDCLRMRIGEDVSEKLDYTPGVFTVERHIRGKWVCDPCETLVQAPVPPQVIDKGMPTAALLAYILIAKYADHLPLYRQERIFARAGFAIPQSTLGAWVGVCGVHLQPIVDALHEEML